MAGTERRAALLTGAASGIGAAIARRFVRDGIDVLAVDRDASAPVPDDRDVSGDGRGTLVPFKADLTSREGNRDSVDAALDEFGRLDIIVACAGFQHVAPIEEFPEDMWDELLAVLLTSPFLLAKYGWSSLVDADGGRFVAVASAHSLVASPFKSGYVSAKHGVLGLVRTMALEGADAGISATALCPGYVRTPLVEKQIGDQARAHAMPEDQVLAEVILASQPVKRLIEPDEVADAAAFLVGPSGRAFTGVAVSMDHGFTAR